MREIISITNFQLIYSIKSHSYTSKKNPNQIIFCMIEHKQNIDINMIELGC